MTREPDVKEKVRDFWEENSCGEVYATGQTPADYYESHSRARYALEPYLEDFAKFSEGRGKDVLEIGVGMGADHLNWARSRPRSLSGIDLTPRAVAHTQRRLALAGLTSDVLVADAERLPFMDASFDLLYSWGVLHHAPDTRETIRQVYRVLRPNGVARIMIYHKYSLTGYMLWARYGLLAGRPMRSLRDIYASHLESPGTKAYSAREAREMFGQFREVNIRTQLCFGDLLLGAAGQRHGGVLLTVARRLWPRWLLARVLRNHGLDLLIEARK